MKFSKQYTIFNTALVLFCLGGAACGTSTTQKSEARNQSSEVKDVYDLVVAEDGKATLQKQTQSKQTEKEGADAGAKEEQKDPEVQKGWDFYHSQCISRVSKEIDFDHFDPSSLDHPIVFEGTLPEGTTAGKDGLQIKGKLKVTELVDKEPLSKECKVAKEKFQR